MTLPLPIRVAACATSLPSLNATAAMNSGMRSLNSKSAWLRVIVSRGRTTAPAATARRRAASASRRASVVPAVVIVTTTATSPPVAPPGMVATGNGRAVRAPVVSVGPPVAARLAPAASVPLVSVSSALVGSSDLLANVSNARRVVSVLPVVIGGLPSLQPVQPERMPPPWLSGNPLFLKQPLRR